MKNTWISLIGRSLYAEYLELELGEDQIEDEPLLYTYYYFHPYRDPSAIFRKGEKNISK